MKTIPSLFLVSLTLGLAACGTVTPTRDTSHEQAWKFIRSKQAPRLAQALPSRSLLLKDSSSQEATQNIVIGYTTATANAVKQLLRGLGSVDTNTLTMEHSNLQAMQVTLPADLSANKVVRALQQSGQVRYAYVSRNIQQIKVPTASFSLQAGMEPSAQAVTDPLLTKQWWLKNVRADQVRNIATGAGVVVAVVDSDFNRLHEDLKAEGKIVTGIDAVRTTDFEKPVLLQPTDPLTNHIHGSGSAGTIAERMGNSVGGAGVAPDAILMPVRIFGSKGYAGDFNVAMGIIWAVDHGAQVINNSWGGGGNAPLLRDAIDYALSNNVVVVGSAGNDYSDMHSGPENLPGVISVGASTNTDTKIGFSNYGPRVDLFAPGTDGLTTYSDTNDGYGLFSGTSMAAPVVSGGAALVLQKARTLGVDLTPYQVKKLLVNGTDPMKDQPQGRLNLQKALSFSANTLPQDGGYVTVQVDEQVSRLGVGLVDVSLIPLDGQNKGMPYTAKTSQGFMGAPGQASFIGIEPGLYDVKVAGPDIWAVGGTRASLSGTVQVKPGHHNAVVLNYAIVADLHEYTNGGMTRNNTFEDATDTSLISPELFEEGFLIGGTFDNSNYLVAVPTKGPDVDIFRVEANAGETFSIQGFDWSISSKASVLLEVYDEEGNLLAESEPADWDSGADVLLNHTVSEDGTYYLKVSNLEDVEGLKSYYALILQKSPAEE
ncbi:S8 family serine peptidase [Deinococcus cellulosilyticus]|uniref:Putative subtilase-type serine protease n=1 Tax=Deinococcus cellulosilyticus (strain DSM 18568 / NBRC 106333 / KACC 11606 / 5516J-15) TaxID=1223518 RepID=A0A511N5K6_DEIC1|nr:S8 family serine peptidase [Deinococcus cellulosilyticus]GEM47681.1 putative subtilase-type serine protease [Deinococcus cellulosilyticus NBRC 106333 = KACC 11606]